MAVKTFSIGDRVEHKLFGEGIILEIDSYGTNEEKTVENNTKITIEFTGEYATKIIIAKHVKHA